MKLHDMCWISDILWIKHPFSCDLRNISIFTPFLHALSSFTDCFFFQMFHISFGIIYMHFFLMLHILGSYAFFQAISEVIPVWFDIIHLCVTDTNFKISLAVSSYVGWAWFNYLIRILSIFDSGLISWLIRPKAACFNAIAGSILVILWCSSKSKSWYW